ARRRRPRGSRGPKRGGSLAGRPGEDPSVLLDDELLRLEEEAVLEEADGVLARRELDVRLRLIRLQRRLVGRGAVLHRDELQRLAILQARALARPVLDLADHLARRRTGGGGRSDVSELHDRLLLRLHLD